VKPEALATIAVRLLGLALALYVLRPAAGTAAELLRQFSINSLSHTLGYYAPRHGYLAPQSATLLLLALGLYMFLSGRWFIRRIVRGLGPAPEGICPACGYDLAGLRVSRCPECGEKLPKGVVAAATSGRNAPAARP